jgi:hypothetical protein
VGLVSGATMASRRRAICKPAHSFHEACIGRKGYQGFSAGMAKRAILHRSPGRVSLVFCQRSMACAFRKIPLNDVVSAVWGRLPYPLRLQIALVAPSAELSLPCILL